MKNIIIFLAISFIHLSSFTQNKQPDSVYICLSKGAVAYQLFR